jgi:hypothetical protein
MDAVVQEINFQSDSTIPAFRQHATIFKLLLNIVTAGTKALVISGNKFLYACVKEVYHM